MATTPTGTELYSTVAPLTQAASPLVTPWFSTDGYTDLEMSYTFTGGTTTMTIEGSGDAISQDTTRAYAALATSPALSVQVSVMHRYIRFRLVQTVADATVTSVYVKTKA